MGTPTCRSSRDCGTSGSHDGHPSQPLVQELRGPQFASGHDSSYQLDQLTSSSASKKAQSASISSPHSPFDDPYHLHFDPLHHDFNAQPFPRLSHHPNQNDGACSHPRSPTQSEAEVNFGRMYGSHPLMGIDTDGTQPFLQTIFPVTKCLSSFHTYYEHATQILRWVRDASHPRPRIQSLQKVLSTHQRSTSPSRIGPPLLERQRQSVCLGPHPNLY